MSSVQFREFTPSDYQATRKISDACFEGHVIDEELALIIEGCWGKGWIAEIDGKVVGASTWLYKTFDERIEAKLQPLIVKANQEGESVFHDCVDFDEQTTVYYHLIVIDPDYQNQGIGTALTKYAISQLPPDKKIKTCVRINNLASIRMIMKQLGVCLTSLKPLRTDMFDSLDTNAEAVQVANISPALEVKQVSTRQTVELGSDMPETEEFLIPVADGTQDDIETKLGQKFVKRIKELFTRGYVISGVFQGSDLNLPSKSYFLCQKSHN